MTRAVCLATQMLSEMIEEALEEGDRCLIFTQFKEMGALLKTHLEELLGQPVLFLHGSVPQKEREIGRAHV